MTARCRICAVVFSLASPARIETAKADNSKHPAITFAVIALMRFQSRSRSREPRFRQFVPIVPLSDGHEAWLANSLQLVDFLDDSKPNPQSREEAGLRL